jgi:hypothetical protein
MMLPTHAIAGMVLALPYALARPEFGSVALVAGFFGGVLPDLDLYVDHRKTLHYPVYYSLFALTLVSIMAVVPTVATVAAAFFLLAAAVHSVADIVGGGLELRPWQATSDRAVYDHYHDQWIAPRRWVHYDGAPEDLQLSFTLALPLLLILDTLFRWLVLSTLLVAVVYAAVRRVLPTVAERLVDDFLLPHLPTQMLTHVPARYLDTKKEYPSDVPNKEQ